MLKTQRKMTLTLAALCLLIFFSFGSLLIFNLLHKPSIVTNSIGMTFVLIPRGEFVMGSVDTIDDLKVDFPKNEVARFYELTDEKPAHKVTITKDFYMQQTEVTIEQFSEFLVQSGYIPESIRDKTGGYGYDSEYDKSRKESQDAFKGRDPKYTWLVVGFPQDEDHPVTNVSWNDAVELAKWLTKKEGKKYRLPSEAEWEYACKAHTGNRYPNSNDPDKLSDIANIFDQEALPYWQRWHDQAIQKNDGFAFTAPVKSFKPNNFGLYDMSGNVWEWTSDNYDPKYYAISPLQDPKGPEEGELKVRRGGSWHTWPLYARCSYRNYNTPSSRYTLLGIRLIRE